MPDNDRFERRLRGKGWRTAYRLAAGAAPVGLVADAVVTAVAHALRREWACPALPQITELVFDGRQACFGGLGQNQNVAAISFDLSTRLAEIQHQQFAYPATRIATRAALEVYAGLLNSSEPTTREEVRGRVGEAFAKQFIDHLFFSRVRDGIMENTGRSSAQQEAFESTLCTELSPQVRRLLRPLLLSGHSALRAPKRRNIKLPVTTDRLNQSLTVLE